MQSGYFNWHELYSPDLALARPFYEALFGWTLTDVPMADGETYTIASANGVCIGGLNATSPDLDLSGWTSYIAVADVDATVDLVSANGGRQIAPPVDVPAVGRIAWLADPFGAGFSIFTEETPGRYPAITGGSGRHGVPSWHELITPDEAGAIAFYAQVAGWGHVAWDMGEFTYNGMTIGEVPVAGIFQAEPGSPTSWTIYFEPNGTLTEAIAAVPALGGELVGDRTPVPGTGEFQIARDPSGAVFGLLESEPM